MGLLSFLGSCVSAVGNYIDRTVSATVRVVREVASAALVFMGESGEAIIGGVKRVWNAVRPYVGVVRAALQAVAANASIHWIGVVAHALDRTLGALTMFERSPVAKVVEAALNWMIRKGKELKERAQRDAFIDVEAIEAAEAQMHGDALRLGMSSVPEELRHEIRTAAMFTDLYAVSGKLNELIDNEKVVKDFDLFLQVRAVQKLIKNLYQKVASAKDTQEISEDDHFLASVARDLIDGRTMLSPEQAARLDDILCKRTGQRLDVFVLEELVPVFRARHDALDKNWSIQNHKLAQISASAHLIDTSKRVAFDNKLSEEEEAHLASLKQEKSALEVSIEETRKKREFALACAGAAEGLVQMLEKSIEELSEEDLEFQRSEIEDICPLLRKCFDNPDAWDLLTSEQRSQLTEYALRHFEAMKRRIVTLQL